MWLFTAFLWELTSVSTQNMPLSLEVVFLGMSKNRNKGLIGIPWPWRKIILLASFPCNIPISHHHSLSCCSNPWHRNALLIRGSFFLWHPLLTSESWVLLLISMSVRPLLHLVRSFIVSLLCDYILSQLSAASQVWGPVLFLSFCHLAVDTNTHAYARTCTHICRDGHINGSSTQNWYAAVHFLFFSLYKIIGQWTAHQNNILYQITDLSLAHSWQYLTANAWNG